MHEPEVGANGRLHSSGRARLYGRALASIYWQRWSAGRVHHWLLAGGDDYFDPNGTVTRKYQLARERFLQGDEAYFASIEYDMIAPLDALERLAALDADIAYGFYVFRHVGNRRWNIATRMEQGGAVWLSDDVDCRRVAWGQTLLVEGCGMGIMLAKRHVVEALPFRNWAGVSCDWAFAYDAKQAGFKQVLDTRVVCGHMTLAPEPCVLWPDAERVFYEERLGQSGDASGSV